MSENQKEKDALKSETDSIAKVDNQKDIRKESFGSLTPLTTAQIITLLVGTTSSNSSYGGY